MQDHPLECICSHRTAPLQRFFRQATWILLPREDFSLEMSDRGLIMRAETEASLASAIETLKSVYGEDLRVGELMIRHRHSLVVEEPHLGVRVLCPARDFNVVRQDLLSRGALILDAEVMPPIGVIRATAPFAKLLGYSQSLAALTGARAREVTWLSHYAPVTEPPAASQLREHQVLSTPSVS